MRSTSSMRDGAASSVCTAKRLSTFGPKVVLNATSAASRPRAITIRPMRVQGSHAVQLRPRLLMKPGLFYLLLPNMHHVIHHLDLHFRDALKLRAGGIHDLLRPSQRSGSLCHLLNN